jgi:hypothetical protein
VVDDDSRLIADPRHPRLLALLGRRAREPRTVGTQQSPESVTGTAAGVPFTALPPAGAVDGRRR